MIDILIRIHNESEWLPLTINSIFNQKGVKINKILILDNNSNDNPADYISFYEDKRFIYETFDEPYKPGKMINHGIKILKKNSLDSSSLLIMSCHCFFNDQNSLKNILEELNCEPKARAAFGRQVPMNISDPRAIRDLTLLYQQESRVINKAASFNNAFSLINYNALDEHLFDENTSNLEDVIWASKDINQGFNIVYASSAEAVHFHGPHHNDDKDRLESTNYTIQKYEKTFNTKLNKPKIKINEILPVFIGTPKNKKLKDYLLNDLSGVKRVLWDEKDKNRFAETYKNLFFLKRKKYITHKSSLYENLEELYFALKDKKLFHPFIIIYDNSFDDKYEITSRQKAKNTLESSFSSAIWPTTRIENAIFTSSDNRKFQTTYDKDSFGKLYNLVGLRGNGLILSANSLIEIKKIFHNSNYYIAKKNED